MLALTATAAGLLIGVTQAKADVDTTFRTNGRLVMEGIDRVYPAVRPNGTVLAVGIGYAPDAPPGDHGNKRTVLRVESMGADGGATPGFGTAGTTLLDVRTLADFDELVEPAGVVVEPSGRLVVQSPSSVGNHLIGVSASGTLDTTFGAGGMRANSFQACGTPHDLAYNPVTAQLVSVAPETNNKRFAEGGDIDNICFGTTVRAYTADGTRVAPYGNAGADGTTLIKDLFAGSIAVDSTGRTLVAGSGSNGFGVGRLNIDGTPDASFGTNGVASFAPSAVAYEGYNSSDYAGFPRFMGNNYAADVATDSAGRVIVVGGSRRTAGGSVDVWVARLTATGALDTTFGTAGMAWVDLAGGDDWGLGVALDSQGRIVVSGSSRATSTAPGVVNASPRRQFTVRLSSAGVQDAAAGTNVSQYGTSADTVAHDMVLAGDTRAYVGGLFNDPYSIGYMGAVNLTASTTASTTTSTTTPTTTSTTPTTQPPTGNGGGGGEFTPISPSRVLDTRLANLGAPAIDAGADRTVSLASVVPAEAVAVAVNMTVTDPTADAFASVYPAGSAWPGTSVVNYKPGQTIANSVVVSLGTARSLAVRVGAGSANVVLDVQGWYTGAGFQAISPSRQFDTRTGGSGPLATAAVDVSLQGVPAGATAVAVNLTVTGASAPSYLSAWPAGAAEPPTSLLNYGPGTTIANGVIVPLGAGGKVTLRNAAGSAEAVVDVMGWVIGGQYHAVQPQRVTDTRYGLGGGILGQGEVRTLNVTPTGVDPATVGAVAVNVTVTEPSSGTFLTAWPAGAAQPGSSIINATAGQTIANGLVLGVEGGQLKVYNNLGNVHVVIDVLGWYPAAA